MGRRAEGATGCSRSPRSARAGLPLTLLLLLGLVPQRPAESPWGLPIVDDDAASMAKELIAQLASLKLEFKPWPGGTHSLHYHYLTLSEPGSALPDFLAVGYVDDQPFIQYDSRLGRAKPQALWVAPVEAQYWETETQKQRGWEKVQQVEIWTMMRYHNRSSGLHSIQRSFGCEIQEDGSTSIFWQFGFDGQDHLSLDLETLSWVSAEPAAIQTKPWLERERCYAEYDKAYLEGLCLTSLHRYLQLGGQNLTRQEPSSCCGPKDVIIITSFFVALLVAGILFWKTWLRAKNKTSYKQAPGGEDLHKSQGPVTEGAAQHIC
ncbi:H-2 class I histocompatibility antigen, Q9 alpha chain-like isoform X3 [Choloepus didactylus]|uniref:H-2 class I histocompatibility antigen, Q9 alpha chain-like isoform X3 n=1 Tax=Choloepus didactylus TaxID=27675 RepID=UPI00189CF0EC|nr:H-2 class I histocompatibility antigen, Q9 alpha chain-like isoform X3 [Choloepus didactylus]